jgi:hypothetical protein
MIAECPDYLAAMPSGRFRAENSVDKLLLHSLECIFNRLHGYVIYNPKVGMLKKADNLEI